MTNNENIYTVYVHTNKINGKMYVGITKREPEKRWQNGTAYRNNPHFNSAIEKYGWSNFEHDIIANNLSHDEATNFEMILIKALGTINNNSGYNMTLGGEGISGYKFSNETIEKMRNNNLGQKNNMFGRTGNLHPLFGKCGELSSTYGRKLTEEQKKKISEKHKGKKLSDEHKENLKKSAHRGADNVHSRKIKQFDLDGNYLKTYENITEVYNLFKIDISNITKVCRGKYKSAGGFKWEYA